MDLQAAVGGLEGFRVADIFAYIGLVANVFAAIGVPRGAVDHQSVLVKLGIGIDQHPLHRLALGQRLAEGYPVA